MSAYDPVFADHLQNPRNVGELESPSAQADVVNQACMDRVRLTMRIDGGRITAARILAQGCPQTIACASLLTTLIEGHSVEAALALEREQIAEAIGGLAVTKRHAAALAIDALRTALDGWQMQTKQ